MFKDYDKYLSTSLKVYIFVLVLILIMKLVGIDYFGLDLNNATILKIDDFCVKYKLYYLYVVVVCYFTSYLIVSFTLNDNSKKLKIFMLITLPITLAIKYCGFYINSVIFVILQIFYLYILICIYSKSISLKTFIKYIKYNILLLLLQGFSLILRNQSLDYKDFNAIIEMLMNLDYLIILYIYYKLKFKKGECFKCHYQEAEAGLSLLTKINLKQLLKRLQVNLHKFRSLSKEEKLSISIYIILSLLWNTLSLAIILLVANLNHTFIECLFILTSFWLSKHAFGKPFHLPSMIQCFIVSNLTYYILNRITTPLGISMFIPILLGVGLSYVTSKLVKKTYKPLYRGMPKDLFNETILKIVDKDSVKYKICYDFYINKKSDLSLSFEYNYSIAGIRKIKDRINDKIKELN